MENFFKISNTLILHSLRNLSNGHITLCQKSSGVQDAVRVDIFIDCISGDLLEDTAQIIFAHIKMIRHLFQGGCFSIMFRNIRDGFRNLLMNHRAGKGGRTLVRPAALEPLAEHKQTGKAVQKVLLNHNRDSFMMGVSVLDRLMDLIASDEHEIFFLT